MKSVTIAALAALLSAGAQAVPTVGHGHRHAGRHAELHLQQRDIKWVTEYEYETKTVYKTVYADGSEPTGSPDTLSSVSTATPVTHTSYDAPASSSQTTSAPAAYTSASSSSQAPAPVQTSSTSSYSPLPEPKKPLTTTTYQAPAPAPTTTTTYQAPAPAPTTSSTTTAAPVAPPATSSAAPYNSGGSSGGTTAGSSYSGDFTHYDPGMGACGITSGPSDSIVAISQDVFDKYTPGGNPNNNPLCGRTVKITGVDGQTYSAKVVDRCTGCKPSDLDLTITLFNTVTNNGDGRVANMKWAWD